MNWFQKHKEKKEQQHTIYDHQDHTKGSAGHNPSAHSPKKGTPVQIDPWIVYSPVSGDVIAQSKIDDPEFSVGLLGPGVGIVPAGGQIVAPVNGRVAVIYQQGHAIGLESDNGILVLIHIGVNTVAMKGIGFKRKVREGDQVHVGDPMLEFDPKLMSDFGLDDTVVVSINNAKEYQIVIPIVCDEFCEAGMPLLRVVPFREEN